MQIRNQTKLVLSVELLLQPVMFLPVVLFASSLLPPLLAQDCGAVPEGLVDTGGLNRGTIGNTAPRHGFPWQVQIMSWDRVTTGTDLLGMFAEIVAYVFSKHSGFVS